jgi:ABC-type transporter Mla maintaining outer membrane lipid asymmetry ATPase subunit MlaF
MICNLAIRYGLLTLAQVGHQKMTLILDEGLIGSCDPVHMHAVIKTLLPALNIKLFMISHHEDLKAAMTTVITVKNSKVTHGEKNEVIVAKEPVQTIKETKEDSYCDKCKMQLKSVNMLARHIKSAKHKANI